MISIKIIRLSGGKANLRHPVRNHLEILDSVEAVKTIREALKQ